MSFWFLQPRSQSSGHLDSANRPGYEAVVFVIQLESVDPEEIIKGRKNYGTAKFSIVG